jgi:hypothetical protein
MITEQDFITLAFYGCVGELIFLAGIGLILFAEKIMNLRKKR